MEQSECVHVCVPMHVCEVSVLYTLDSIWNASLNQMVEMYVKAVNAFGACMCMHVPLSSCHNAVLETICATTAR